jgi:hypothetical protein
MRARDTRHQRHGKHNKVFFTVSKRITRARQRAFEKTEIANKMLLSGLRQFEPVVLDHDLNGEPMRLIWQGRLGFSDIWRYARGSVPQSRSCP